MADLSERSIFKNTNFEVLTELGFKDFKGIMVGTNLDKLTIKFSNGKELTCTPKHKIVTTSKLDWVYAKDLKLHQTIYSNIRVESICKHSNTDLVYELLHVSDSHNYFTNNILSKNCLILDELAFVDNNLAVEFWRSVYPIISSSKKSKIFIASTPNGSQNLFYELYTGALKGENGWHAERVDWHEVPGRDEEWKQKTIKSLGSGEAFDQEFGNQFLTTGESSISEDLFNKHKTNAADPQFVFEENCYFIWNSPIPDHIYVAGVDVSEGIGHDASCVQILDITDLTSIEQVALYHNTKINPVQFIPKLHEILQHWGNPPVCIERNNCGAQVVDQLKNQFNYENIVSYGARAGATAFNRIGIFSHTNTKFRGVSTMRYYVNELLAVKIHDIKTLIELKSFVRKENGTWSAVDGTGIHDDRVMALIWALLILDDELVTRHFEVTDYDENKRPSRLKTLDYGVRTFNDPTKILYNIKTGDPQTLPVLMNSNMTTEYEDDLAAMKQDGWTTL